MVCNALEGQSMRMLGVTVGLMAASLSAPLPAQTPTRTEADLIACSVKPGNAERLACYDKAVAGLSADARRLSEKREADAKALAVAEAATAAKLASDAAAKAEADKLAAFGRDSMNYKDRPPEATEALNALAAKVSETLSTLDGRLVFILDNGQMWRQSEPLQLPPVRAGADVVLKKGLMGSFMLTLPKMGRTIKVVRMR